MRKTPLILISGLSGLALAGCTTADLEYFNASLACDMAYGDPYSQDACVDDYYETGYLPQPAPVQTAGYVDPYTGVYYPGVAVYGYTPSPYASGYGSGYGVGNGSYIPSAPDEPFTLGGFDSAYSRSLAIDGAYTQASSYCTARGGTLGATEDQNCSKDGDEWTCTVRVWCG